MFQQICWPGFANRCRLRHGSRKRLSQREILMLHLCLSKPHKGWRTLLLTTYLNTVPHRENEEVEAEDHRRGPVACIDVDALKEKTKQPPGVEFSHLLEWKSHTGLWHPGTFAHNLPDENNLELHCMQYEVIPQLSRVTQNHLGAVGPSWEEVD